MPHVLPPVEHEAVEYLVKKLDHRMGAALFVGAALPEVAMHVARRGLSLTIVEADKGRIDRFLAPVREAKLDRTVNVDFRPYEGIEFLASSYNAIVVWGGIPDQMPPALFFKKVRRELKAGGSLYLRLPVRPQLSVGGLLGEKVVGRMPLKAMTAMESLVLRFNKAVSLEGALAIDDVRQAADAYLNVEDIAPLSIVAERMSLLPAPLLKILDSAPSSLTGLVSKLDHKLMSRFDAEAVASSVIIQFARTREFGKVFRI